MTYKELAYNGRLFAIGDIHGCYNELALLLDFLIYKKKLTVEDQVVFIGDYIDRGSNPKEVVSLLIDFKSRFPLTIFLRGNHEDMFLGYLQCGGSYGDAFLHNGGIDTIASYGLDFDLHGQALARELPIEHYEFYTNLEDLVYDKNYIFVHAGLDPLRDFYEQTSEDLFWIRDEFINNRHSFGKTIVFGHTPQDEILFDLPYKMGIDTGCCYGNKLTCCNFNEKVSYQILLNDKTVITKKFK